MGWRVFLDLEETVIDSWHSGMLVNSTRVRDWLQRNRVASVGIFSFAIWDTADCQEFDRRLRPWLSRALDTSIDTVVSTETLWHTDTKHSKIHFENISDYIGIRGKAGAFQNWCRWQLTENTVLIDDVVPNQELFLADANRRIVTVNIQDLDRVSLIEPDQVLWAEKP